MDFTSESCILIPEKCKRTIKYVFHSLKLLHVLEKNIFGFDHSSIHLFSINSKYIFSPNTYFLKDMYICKYNHSALSRQTSTSRCHVIYAQSSSYFSQQKYFHTEFRGLESECGGRLLLANAHP